MNEREFISLQLDALDAADLRLDELLAAGKIDARKHETLTRENMTKRDRLAMRREKLVATGTGVTPVIDSGRVARLREAVRQLQLQNANEAAVRALLEEVLTVLEATADEPADAASIIDKPRSAGGRAVAQTAVPLILALVGGIGLGLLLARVLEDRD